MVATFFQFSLPGWQVEQRALGPDSFGDYRSVDSKLLVENVAGVQWL